MRVLVDTNVIVDLLLQRSPWHAEAAEIPVLAAEGRIDPFVTASTLTDVFYICRKDLKSRETLTALKFCIDAFKICEVGRTEIESAFNSPAMILRTTCRLLVRLQTALKQLLLATRSSPRRRFPS